MSQRDSGYAREVKDAYQTPYWATRALLPFLPKRVSSTRKGIHGVWECAAGEGKMADELFNKGYAVLATDIQGRPPTDFLQQTKMLTLSAHIITNPPYDHAREFIEHALRLTRKTRGVVAMLLRTDYDHAKTRAHLFKDCPQFAKKVVLTKRIVWFEDTKATASPSFNHAWFIWDWRNTAKPVIEYYVES